MRHENGIRLISFCAEVTALTDSRHLASMSIALLTNASTTAPRTMLATTVGYVLYKSFTRQETVIQSTDTERQSTVKKTQKLQ